MRDLPNGPIKLTFMQFQILQGFHVEKDVYALAGLNEARQLEALTKISAFYTSLKVIHSLLNYIYLKVVMANKFSKNYFQFDMPIVDIFQKLLKSLSTNEPTSIYQQDVISSYVV